MSFRIKKISQEYSSLKKTDMYIFEKIAQLKKESGIPAGASGAAGPALAPMSAKSLNKDILNSISSAYGTNFDPEILNDSIELPPLVSNFAEKSLKGYSLDQSVTIGDKLSAFGEDVSLWGDHLYLYIYKPGSNAGEISETLLGLTKNTGSWDPEKSNSLKVDTEYSIKNLDSRYSLIRTSANYIVIIED